MSKQSVLFTGLHSGIGLHIQFAGNFSTELSHIFVILPHEPTIYDPTEKMTGILKDVLAEALQHKQKRNLVHFVGPKKNAATHRV